MSGLKEFGESAARSVLERIGRGVSRVQERKPLPYDLLESDGAYLVVFDAPGVQRSDVQVRFLDGEVQVRIDRFRDFHEGFEMRFPGRGLSLDGSAELPEDAAVDATDAKATLTANGTLRVEIPKDERARDVAVTDESGTDAADGRTGENADERGVDDGSDDAEAYETDADGDETDEGVDATDSATGVSATDTADGVGSTDSTDVDADNVDRDVASSDPDRDESESGDDEDEEDESGNDEEDDYEMSSVEETVAESDGETVKGDTDPDEDRT